jgi:hypothetical protein
VVADVRREPPVRELGEVVSNAWHAAL